MFGGRCKVESHDYDMQVEQNLKKKCLYPRKVATAGGINTLSV